MRKLFFVLSIFIGLEFLMANCAFAEVAPLGASGYINFTSIPNTANYGQSYNITVQFHYEWIDRWNDAPCPTGGAVLVLYEDDGAFGDDEYKTITLGPPSNASNATGSWNGTVTFQNVVLSNGYDGQDSNSQIQVICEIGVDTASPLPGPEYTCLKTITIVVTPQLCVSKTSVTMGTVNIGSSKKSDNAFYISNCGNGGTVNWSISSNKNWLKVSPTSGSTSNEEDYIDVTVDASASGLAYDTTYSGTLTVNGGSAGTKYVNVSFKTNEGPKLRISPSSKNFGDVEIDKSKTINSAYTVYNDLISRKNYNYV